MQRDPDERIEHAIANGIARYGNRLFCDYELDGTAHYRRGNADTYRKWFTDTAVS